MQVMPELLGLVIVGIQTIVLGANPHHWLFGIIEQAVELIAGKALLIPLYI